MLKREPPDGKEKPEPPKIHKPEAGSHSHHTHTLSRKNSKSDLIERSAVGAGNSVMSVDSGSDLTAASSLTSHMKVFCIAFFKNWLTFK